jgi:hypothetical protein
MKTENTLCNDATFVGNRSLRCLDLPGPDRRTIREKYIIGEPHDCPIGSADEMKKRGYVGIYLKNPVVKLRLPHSNFVIQKSW